VRGAARKGGPYRDGVDYPYIYEPTSILTHGPLGLLAIAAVFSTVPVGNQIAEYL